MIINIKNKNCVEIAAKLIEEGKIIIYPTDTLYGFGVDATNRVAINNLNLLKKREQMYSIILNSIFDIDNFAYINEQKLDYINKILPGAYTVILKSRKSNLSKLVNMNSGTIGIRIPKSNFILDVVKKIMKPIVTTSVNIHGQKSIENVNEMEKEFPEINIFKENLVSNSSGSTIIDLTKNNPQILRKGDGEIV